MKKNKKLFGLLMLIILVAVFLSLFPRKVKFQETITACTYEGETIVAQFDVELWNYWYTKDIMNGTVTVDGVIYEHLEYESYGDESRSFWFAIPRGDMLHRMDNALNVSLYGKDFEAFILVKIQNGESKMYIGPASNVDEIQKIKVMGK